MFKTFYYSIKIDTYYAINSFIYILKKMPILKDLLTDDCYTSGFLKFISGIIGVILSLTKMFFSRILYFLIIYFISNYISNDNMTFYHIFFIFSLIGMFINNKLLNANMKKYLSIVVFKMNAKNYLQYNLIWTLFTNFLLNSFCFYLFDLNLEIGLYLILFQIGLRVIGENLEIMYFRKYGNFWYNNTGLYFTILIALLLCSLLPYIGICINKEMICISALLSSLFGIISYFYMFLFNDYNVIFKRINTLSNAINNDSSNRQSIVEVKNKDIKINQKKIESKTGYDYFNTIFFERHRDILLRAVKFISFVLIVSYVILGYLVISNKNFSLDVNNFLSNRLGWFVLIMYFINRGSIVTQAMFYNCDHAMLKYNFFRESNVIIGLFKMRLKTITKVNLLPALIISFGNIGLFMLSGGSSLVNYIGIFLFIIVLSIFFSLHYLVIYYLLQPYNQDMQMKKMSYSIVSIITYLVCYWASKLFISSLQFSLIGLFFCILYIFIGLKLVENYAPRTFKIN